MTDEKESTALMESGTKNEKEQTGLQRMYWTHIRQHACEFVTAMILLFNTCSASYLARVNHRLFLYIQIIQKICPLLDSIIDFILEVAKALCRKTESQLNF